MRHFGFWKCFSDSDASKTKRAKDDMDSSVLRRFAFR